jgi:class 3 adenylate cyclase
LLIPGARFIEYPGGDTYNWVEAPGLDEIEEFLTGRRREERSDRVLATVLFTDIVGSTEHASRLGDGRWRMLLGEHNSVVRFELERWRGTEIKTIGDGFLATFDGPARAVQGAAEIVDSVNSLALRIRAGLHTGECELVAGDVAGIAVHIGRAGDELRRASGGARVEHGQGSGGRIGTEVRGPRATRTQGRAR